MKPEQIVKWKVTRQNGMWRYVLVQGVLLYGLSCFVVITFVVEQLVLGFVLSAGFIAFSAASWAIGGVVLGLIMWFIQERQFRKAGAATA